VQAMKPIRNRRNSNCVVCGTRLSVKTDAGDIQWHPSLVDDRGIYCDACYAKLEADRTKRNSRPKEE
jgi:hypothetical protein